MSQHDYISPSLEWVWQVPTSWAWVRMADIADIVGGGTPPTSDPSNFKDGDIPWITPADLSGYKEKFIPRGARNITKRGLRHSGAKLMPAGTVLFSSRAPVGYVAIAANPVTTNQGFKSFVLASGVDPSYVYFYLKRARGLIEALAGGTTFKEISGAKATQIPVPLAPSFEQRRIVAEIDKQFTRLDAAVASLQQARANLKRYRASVLRTACEGLMVPTEAELARREGRTYEPATALLGRILKERQALWAAQERRRGKYKEPQPPDTSNLPPFPEGWVWASLDQITASLEGGTAATATNAPTSRPVLRSSAVRQGYVDLDDYRYLPDNTAQAPDPYIAPGDLLFTRLSGSLEYVGNCALVPELLGRRLEFPDRIFRARCVPGVFPHFVQLCFADVSLRRPLEQKAKSTAGHQRISLSDLRAFCLPLPPHAEQRRIVEEVERHLSVIRAGETTVEVNLRRAQRLRQAILRRAFEGKLVSQDPTDEPASVLLERIRAEREHAGRNTAEVRRKTGRRPKTQEVSA